MKTYVYVAMLALLQFAAAAPIAQPEAVSEAVSEPVAEAELDARAGEFHHFTILTLL